jgi:hypothetical protein
MVGTDLQHTLEKTSYLTRMQRIRSETTQRYTLLCLKNPDHAPLLPLGSDSPDLFTTSPIASFFIPSIADDEIRATLLSSFMGPGPWSLEANIQLPGRGSMLTVSNKNRRSNMLVAHTLRVALRVGRAGAPSRAFQDLVLETPVHIFPVSGLFDPRPSPLKQAPVGLRARGHFVASVLRVAFGLVRAPDLSIGMAVRADAPTFGAVGTCSSFASAVTSDDQTRR